MNSIPEFSLALDHQFIGVVFDILKVLAGLAAGLLVTTFACHRK